MSLYTSECGAPGQIQTTVKCERLIRRLKTNYSHFPKTCLFYSNSKNQRMISAFQKKSRSKPKAHINCRFVLTLKSLLSFYGMNVPSHAKLPFAFMSSLEDGCSSTWGSACQDNQTGNRSKFATREPCCLASLLPAIHQLLHKMPMQPCCLPPYTNYCANASYQCKFKFKFK